MVPRCSEFSGFKFYIRYLVNFTVQDESGRPFACGGRVLVRFRANGYSLFARRSGEPLARLRLTGNGDEVVLLYPSHRGGWGALGDFGASARSLDAALQCLSDNPYFLDRRETYG